MEGDEFAGPELAHHLDLFRLARAAGVPRHVKCGVFHVVPADADAEPDAPAGQDIHLRGLLGDQPGLPLRQDQHAAGQADGFGDGCEVGHCREGFMERIGFVINRLPVAAWGSAENVVGDFDMGEPERFGRLCPVADFRGVSADVAGGE